MKKIIIAIFILLLLQSLQSASRTLSEAETVCNRFLELRGKSLDISSTEQIQTSEILLYVYNLEPDGFVITSSDDMFHPVIAYSWTGEFSQRSSQDLQYTFIKEDMSKRKAYYMENRNLADQNYAEWQNMLNGIRPERDFQQWPIEGNSYTGGWCDTQWTQSGIFNQYCPNDHSGERSVVGCVATAMAQIMHFHEYIGNPSFSNSDDYLSGWWNTIHIDNDHEEFDFPDWSELNDLISLVDDHYENGIILTDDDKAALSYACGVSVEMGYSSSGSGANTSDVASALRNKFDYDTANWNENTGNSFYNAVASDMKEMKPCEFSIYTSGWNDGHAIVCDGYNNDDYFHLNYGWGSSNIGWYYLPEGMPSDYSIIGGAVRNIEGGEHPVSVNGTLNGPAQLSGGYVFFVGEDYCYEAYCQNDGSFEIPALKKGWYSVSAVNGRTWYVEEEIYLENDITNLVLDMYNYEALQGQVSADFETWTTNVALYEDNELIALAVTDEYGLFEIPDILPGDYVVTGTSLSNVFGYTPFSVDPNSQFVSIDLQYYTDEREIAWAAEPAETYSLVPIEIACAIKITPEDLTDYQGYVFKKVSLIPPVNPDEGSITIALWKGNDPVMQIPLEDFVYGQEISVEFPVYQLIDPQAEYYAGYIIDSESGVVAWHDNGPRVAGKGAWFNVTNWVELNPGFDFNFCISAEVTGVSVDNDPHMTELVSTPRIISSYPNPFSQNGNRATATLQFELAAPAEVIIELFNIKGQMIAEVFHDTKSTGRHQINWQPNDLSSGIYFYKLAVDGVSCDYQKTTIIK